MPIVGGGVIKKGHLHWGYEVNALTIGVFRQLHDAERGFRRRRSGAEVFLWLRCDRADTDRQIKGYSLAHIKSAVVIEPGIDACSGTDLGENDVIRVRIAVEQRNRVTMGVAIYVIAGRAKLFCVVALTQAHLEGLQV